MDNLSVINCRLIETKAGCVQMFLPLFQSGYIQLGAKSQNWSIIDDGFKYHDIFHFTFYSMLGWSPVSKGIFGFDDPSLVYEEGYRSQILEEAVIAFIIQEYTTNSKIVPSDELLNEIEILLYGFYGNKISKNDWKRAILVAIEIWEIIKVKKDLAIELDLKMKSIRIRD